MDLVETFAQEQKNTKWRFALTTNETIFGALLKNIPMECIDAVLPEHLLRRSDVNCRVSNVTARITKIIFACNVRQR